MDSEEQTEVCPLCLTDSFLEDGKDGDKFFRCAITGDVVNVSTRKVLSSNKVYEIKPVIERPSFEVTRLEYERRETKALQAYDLSGKAEDYHKAFK